MLSLHPQQHLVDPGWWPGCPLVALCAVWPLPSWHTRGHPCPLLGRALDKALCTAQLGRWIHRSCSQQVAL